MKYLIVLFLVSLFNGLGQLFWKLGLDGFNFKKDLITIVLALLKNVNFLLGSIFYFFSLILWLFVISKVDISIAYPFIALSFIFVLIGGYFLGESIDIYKIIGIVFIIIGILFISKARF